MSLYRVVDTSGTSYRNGQIVKRVSEVRAWPDPANDFVGYLWYEAEDGLKQLLSDEQVEKIA